MRFGLRAKILLLAAILLVAFGAAFSAFTTTIETELARRRLLERAQSVASVLALAMSHEMPAASQEKLSDIIRTVSDAEGILYVTVWRPDGHTLAEVKAENRFSGTIEPEFGKRAARARTGLSQFGEIVLDVSQPIVLDGKRVGGVRVGLSTASLTRDVALIQKRNRVFGALFVAFLMLIAAFLVRHVLRSIAPLLHGAEAISNGPVIDHREFIRRQIHVRRQDCQSDFLAAVVQQSHYLVGVVHVG